MQERGVQKRFALRSGGRAAGWRCAGRRKRNGYAMQQKLAADLTQGKEQQLS